MWRMLSLSHPVLNELEAMWTSRKIHGDYAARKQYCDEKKAIGANLRAHMSGREDRSFLAVQHVRPMRWWGWGFAAKNGSRGREVRSRRRDESGGPGVVPM